ncbi:MAG: M28 family peptidase [candidate division Zixibacteria bacterium]|nr:M28 family peptidase [candidate division Zixibacteria bacterium]
MILLSLSCAGSKSNKVIIPPFDGDRAFEYLEKQIAFGPRVPGSTNAENCRQYLIDFFTGLGAVVDTMMFTHFDKVTGKAIAMVNIVARFKGSGSDENQNYLLSAHYDSRPRAEYDSDTTKRMEPIPGANDGASGVAVLMELGNLLAKSRCRVNIDLALLDGEDWGRPGDLDEYFLGAKEMISDIKGKYKFALVIDMVGDKDLKIYKEELSLKYYPEISKLVWETAAGLGEKAFIDSVGDAIYDDHLSFMTIDLPSAVIIDFDYPYWHTTLDTPDKCSVQSLQAVGQVIITLLYRL